MYVCVCGGGSCVFPLLPPRPRQMDTIRQQWEKRTRNIINKNANRYATDGVFFFFFLDVFVPPTKCTQRQIADHFRTGLYFLRPPPANDRSPQSPYNPSSRAATDIDDPREIFIFFGLKTTSCGFFFFTPTLCVCIYIYVYILYKYCA